MRRRLVELSACDLTRMQAWPLPLALKNLRPRYHKARVYAYFLRFSNEACGKHPCGSRSARRRVFEDLRTAALSRSISDLNQLVSRPEVVLQVYLATLCGSSTRYTVAHN